MRKDEFPLFVSVRDDGSGSRFIGLLNTFYLAQKMNLDAKDHVRFFWTEKPIYYLDNTNTEDEKKFKKENNYKIIGASIEKKEEVFAKEFIQKYYLDNIFDYNTNWLFTNHTYDKSICELSHPWWLDLKRLKEMVENKEFKYFFVHHDNLAAYFHVKDYRREVSKIWKSIQFIPKLEKIMQEAREKASQLGKNLTCIHLRSGDALFYYAEYRKYNLQTIYQATPYELAMQIALKQKGNVVIIGDDVDSTQILAQTLNKKNIFSIEHFRDSSKMSALESFMFDIIFISLAQKIYGTHSGVVRLAELINEKSEIINSYSVFSEKEQYEILKQNFKKLNLHPCQKAFSLFHLFVLGKKLNEDFDVLQDYLQKALEYDEDNDKYRIHLVDTLIRKKEIQRAEDYLKQVFKTRKEQYLNTLFLKGWEGIVFAEVYARYFESFDEKYPCINEVVYEILNHKFGAAYIVKSHLSYKLGYLFLSSRSFKNILAFPKNLTHIIKNQKNDKKLQQRVKLDTLVLEEFEDYSAALKIKNYLSYKIGHSIIQAQKNWYKGGYFVLPFKLLWVYFKHGRK